MLINKQLAAACTQARKPRSAKKQTANRANSDQDASNIIESAGNASANHLSLSPLQTNAITLIGMQTQAPLLI